MVISTSSDSFSMSFAPAFVDSPSMITADVDLSDIMNIINRSHRGKKCTKEEI